MKRPLPLTLPSLVWFAAAAGGIAAQGDDADVVTTVDGDELAGRLVRADGAALVLETAEGPRTVSWSDVVRVELDAASPDAPARDSPRLWLRSGQELPAVLEGGDRTAGSFRLPHVAEPVVMPWRFVQALRSGPAGSAGERFAERVLDPAADADLLYADGGGGEVRRLSVELVGIDGDRLVARFGGRERTVPLARVRGLVFARRHGAAPDPLPLPRTTVVAAGLRLAGRIEAVDGERVALRLAEGARVVLPRSAVSELRIATDKLLPLTDLEPEIEQTPALDRSWPPLVDRGPGGRPIELGGRAFRRGLVLFPRTRLTYRLPRAFDLLRVVVGQEDDAGPDASAVVRVLGDGRVLYDSGAWPRDRGPEALEIPLEGVAELALEADFGPRLDLGDAVAFARPQLVRR